MTTNIENLELDSEKVDKIVAKALKKNQLVIQEEDFILVALGLDLFDFYALKKIKPKGKPERYEFCISGYAMQMHNIVRRIANARLKRGLKQESLDIKEFLTQYQTYNDSARKQCENIMSDLEKRLAPLLNQQSNSIDTSDDEDYEDEDDE